MAGAIPQPRQSCQFLFCLMKNPLLSVFDRYPIRGTFVGRCASAEKQSAKSRAHRAKLPNFRFFISPSRLMPFASRRAVLVLCLNVVRTYIFHCRIKTKRASCSCPNPVRIFCDKISKAERILIISRGQKRWIFLRDLGSPERRWIFPCLPATRFGHLSGTCQNGESMTDFYRNIILTSVRLATA